VGDDKLGKEIIAALQRINLRTDCLQVDPEKPTGTVDVTLAPDGQPQFMIHEAVAWDELAIEEQSQRIIEKADAVCFGTLAQRSPRSRQTIQQLVVSSPSRALRILDINLRQQYHSPELIEKSLSVANVLKINDAELPQLAKWFSIAGSEQTIMEKLARQFELQTVALTRGNRGSLLYSRGKWSEHPGASAKVVDTVGAGDSFTAAVAIGLLRNWDLDVINERANGLAAFVCSQPGATPALPKAITAPFRN